jgi:hypothetical protein
MNENIIFKAIVGSQSYGTATPTSDIDYKGVYMQATRDLVSFGYKEQIDVTDDETYYELRRFIQLLQSANPTMLELLYSPEDCIIKTTPQFQLLVENRDLFLTKKCRDSFGGYAIAQIQKASGLNKKMNWEAEKVAKKDILDFCYVLLENEKSVKIRELLEIPEGEFSECKHIGLAKVNNFPDTYSMYYFPNLDGGICTAKSNDVQTRSIPKGYDLLYYMRFDKNSYSMYCKDYKSYQDWLANRNTQRYVDTGGRSIDGKNLLHCRRLIDMAKEIATEGIINVRRPNADYLLSIRKGLVEPEKLIAEMTQDIKDLDELFKNSNLPVDCDKDVVNNLLIKIREL